MSSYYFEPEEGLSLALQQVLRRKGKIPVLFACICEDGELVRRLIEWFHGKALRYCQRGGAENIAERVRDDFVSRWEEWEGTAGLEDFVMLFCVDGECFYAWCGDMDIRVLNREFDRRQVRSLTRRTEGLCCERAVLEERVGLLLGTRDFFESLSKETVCACINVDVSYCQEQADRHLAELCGEAARRGMRKRAAILIMTKREGDGGNDSVEAGEFDRSGGLCQSLSRAGRKRKKETCL